MELLPVIGAALVVYFLFLPLFLWGFLGEDAAPSFDSFNATQHAAPADVTAFLHDNIAALAAEGFKQVGDLFRQRGTMTIRVAILPHADGVTGTVVVVAAHGAVSPMVEFVPWFQALERDHRLESVTVGPNYVDGWFAVDPPRPSMWRGGSRRHS